MDCFLHIRFPNRLPSPGKLYNFVAVKRSISLKTGSILMALLVLLVSVGLNVSYHQCSVKQTVTYSFGDASELCKHCKSHHHNHMTKAVFEDHLKIIHLGSKCCCEDFSSKIQVTDNYVFSLLKNLVPDLGAVVVPYFQIPDVDFERHETTKLAFWKVPILRLGPEKVIFYSELKLDPFIS
jgi:hypothetical protein